MNKIYAFLLFAGLSFFMVYEISYNYKEAVTLPDYNILEDTDSTLAMVDRIMSDHISERDVSKSLIDSLETRINREGTTRSEIERVRKIFMQREKDAFQKGLHHDTLIIDTVIYHERHIDTVVYDTHRIVVLDTIRKDTTVYEEKVTGWKRKRKKKNGNGWKGEK